MNKISFIITSVFAVLAGLGLGASVSMTVECKELQEELNEVVNEAVIVREGTVIAISEDGCIAYCISDNTPEGYVDQVDIFDEVFCNCYERSGHECRLRIGNRVLYSMDLNKQDAYLLAKLHD